ncbi:MAG: hypothetical protein AAF674_19125 [Pseudomonadota bacterium]
MLRSKRFLTIGAVISALVLAGCSGPTPYGPAVERSGYSDTPLEDNRFRVTFAGNSLTDRDTVENYMLFRAAEVTLASGKDWFRIADRDTQVESQFRGFSHGLYGGSAFFRSRSVFGVGFGVHPLPYQGRSRYEAIANIQVFEGDKPEDDPNAYDARSVLSSLGPTIQRPKAE